MGNFALRNLLELLRAIFQVLTFYEIIKAESKKTGRKTMALTKAELVHSVYRNHQSLSKLQAAEAVEAFLRISKDSLVGGSDLLLSGFGKFHVRDKHQRRGRNPQTGEALMLEPRRVVTFKPSGILRRKVNGED